MKRSLFIVLLIGLTAGFGIGFFVAEHSHPPEKQVAATRKTQPNLTNKSATPEEQHLLQQASDLLEESANELQAAQTDIHKLNRDAQLSKWLADNNEGESYGVLQKMFEVDQFKPSDDMVEAFGWDTATADALKRLSEETMNNVMEWESKHAECTEATNTKISFEIEAIPESIKNQYLAAVASLIGPNDMKILSSSLEQPFSILMGSRRISFEVNATPESQPTSDTEGLTMNIRFSADAPTRMATMTQCSFDPENPDLMINRRWKHLIDTETF